MSEHVGLTIKKLREDRKLSKSRLAREAGISDAYVVQIEHGDRSPSRDILLRLAHALRVPPHDLLVPAGFYSHEEITAAEQCAMRSYDEMESHYEPMPPDAFDRFLAEEYADIERYRDVPEEEVAFSKVMTLLDLPSEQYWGWSKPLAAYPPEHWDTLSDADRRLVQRLINRMAQDKDPEA